jgi:hypothetical protein
MSPATHHMSIIDPWTGIQLVANISVISPHHFLVFAISWPILEKIKVDSVLETGESRESI